MIGLRAILGSGRAALAAALAVLLLAACGPTPGRPAATPTPAAPLAQLPNYVPHATPTPESVRPTPAPSPAALPATPSPHPSISPSPVPVDPRFGIVFDGLYPAAAAHALQVLHVEWFDGAAAGLPPYPPTQLQGVPQDLTELAALARRYPGRVWSLHAEPNGISARDADAAPAAYAARLHAVATALHAADPTARLIGPDVIDWSAGCIGCGGMQTGEAWTVAMRDAYLAAYHEEVPFDVWSIHTYPLDWQHLPTVDYRLMEQQLVDLRTWLDGIPSLRGKPIWDTELGVHWGYTAYAFEPVNGKTTLVPAGTRRGDLVADYLRQFLAWLDANGAKYGIERWFVWAAYNPDAPGDHAGAISLLDGPGPGAQVTSFGRILLEAEGRQQADPGTVSRTMPMFLPKGDAVPSRMEAIETINAEVAKRHWGELLDRVARKKTRVVVEENGTPIAAVVSTADLARLNQLDRQLAEDFQLVGEIREAFRDIPPEEIEREADRALAGAGSTEER